MIKRDYLLLKTAFDKLIKYFSRLALFGCLFFTINTHATPQPVIISSINNKYHQSIVKSISSNLEKYGIKANVINTGKQAIPDNINEFIISFGNEAVSFLDKKNISAPQLRVLSKVDTTKNPARKNRSYLSMTPPVCQQFALIKSLNSKWKSVSVLLSGPNTNLARKLESCAKQYNLIVNAISLNQYVNISDALNTSLLSSDVLLALPDSSIYNTRTVKNILLTTYRHRVPVIGFSESFVRAGALVAIHSSTNQLGIQISDLIKKYYNHENIRQNYIYPKYVEITINRDVAKSLGIILLDKKTIKENLKREFHE